jgi:hypothetical protein
MSNLGFRDGRQDNDQKLRELVNIFDAWRQVELSKTGSDVDLQTGGIVSIETRGEGITKRKVERRVDRSGGSLNFVVEKSDFTNSEVIANESLIVTAINSLVSRGKPPISTTPIGWSNKVMNDGQSFRTVLTQDFAGLDIEDLLDCVLEYSDVPDLRHHAQFQLAIWRSVLRSLLSMHVHGWIHCDAKIDNFCVPVTSWSRQGQQLTLSLTRINVIDFGMSLLSKGERERQRNDLSAINRARKSIAAVGPVNYLPGIYEEAMQSDGTGEMSAWEKVDALDCSVDLYSVGVAIEETIKFYPPSQAGPNGTDRALYENALGELVSLPTKLKARALQLERGNSETKGPLIPEIERIIAGIDRCLEDNQFANFTVRLRTDASAIPRVKVPASDVSDSMQANVSQENSPSVKVEVEVDPKSKLPRVLLRFSMFGLVALALLVFGLLFRGDLGSLFGRNAEVKDPPGPDVSLKDPRFVQCKQVQELRKEVSKDGAKPNEDSLRAGKAVCTQLISEAALKSPSKASALLYRAQISRYFKDYSAALADLELAGEISPQDSRIDLSRAEVYALLVRPDDAFTSLKKALMKGGVDFSEDIERDAYQFFAKYKTDPRYLELKQAKGK